MRSLSTIFFFLTLCLFALQLNALECNYGPGYSIDLIKKIHKKVQKKAPKYWKNNIYPHQVRKGDVAIFAKQNYVAYVNYVISDKQGKKIFIVLRSWNTGKKWVDYTCRITNKFGRLTTQTVRIKDVDGGFWRPE